MPRDATAAGRLPGPSKVTDHLRILRRLLSEPAPTLDDCAERFGPTFSVGAGPMRMVVVGEPDQLSDVFGQPNSSYRWGHFLNVLGFITGPTSMLVSDGDVHKRRRSAVQPAFARRRLDGWIPMIVADTDAMIDQRLQPAIDDAPSVEVYPFGKDLVIGITVKAFFGNGLEHRTQEISEIFDESQAYLELPAIQQFPHRIPGTRRARVRDGIHRFNRLVDEEVARRRRLLAETGGHGRGDENRDDGDDGDDGGADLLDAFIADDGVGLTGAEIHDQVNTLIGAGFNTTAATLAWTIHRALATPGVWDRLREEADGAFGPVTGAATDDDDANDDGQAVDRFGPDTLKRLPYAKAVVHEALRIHPAGVVSPRQAVVDVPVGGYVIPKNAMVLWSPYLAGRDPEAWPDPLVFDPDRHLDPTPEAAARMEAAWVPFGRGPRRCIGFALAQMELTLIVARLAQRLDLDLVDPRTPEPHGLVVNRPAGGVPVRRRAASGVGASAGS